MTRRTRRAGALALALMIAATVPSAASAGTSEGRHCIFPDGTDYNEIWGVEESVVWFNCTEIDAGGAWWIANGWGMNDKFQYKWKQEGFVPAGDTPIEDFLAKLVGVKVVVDGGTDAERVYVFTDTSLLFIVDNRVNAVTMGVQDPLPAGTHHVASYWRLSALHCDGSPKPKGGCLPAGDTLGFETDFLVVPAT